MKRRRGGGGGGGNVTPSMFWFRSREEGGERAHQARKEQERENEENSGECHGGNDIWRYSPPHYGRGAIQVHQQLALTTQL
jgi:hypothetical protein